MVDKFLKKNPFCLRFPESKNTHTGVHNLQGREKYNQTGNLQWQLPRKQIKPGFRKSTTEFSVSP